MNRIVRDSDSKDRYGKLVRLCPDTMRLLDGLHPKTGGLITITGKRKTVAEVKQANITNNNCDYILTNKMARVNAGCDIGDRIEVGGLGDIPRAKKLKLKLYSENGVRARSHTTT